MSLNDARNTLTAAWVESLKKVLETMTGTLPEVEWQAIDGPLPAAGGAVRTWWADGVSNVPQPSVWIGAGSENWTVLGQWILSVLGVDDASDDDIQSTCRDVVAQVASAFATELAKQMGVPLNSVGANSAEGPVEGAQLVNLDIALPSSGAKIGFVCAFHPSLAAALSAASAETESAAEAAPAEPEPVLSDPIAELRFPVHARLGATRVQLGDVFQWTVGSVVEIGRRITEPIDILIGDRLIAKGQVVVSNGYYGARVVSLERSNDAEVF